MRNSTRNVRSQGIPKKLGFVHEATLKNRATDARGARRDVMIWSLFRTQYRLQDFAHFKISAFDIAGEPIIW